MATTKVEKSGIQDDAIDSNKLEPGTQITNVDIKPGSIPADRLPATLDLSSSTVTLANSTVTNDQLTGSIANAKLTNSSITVNGTSTSLGGSLSAGKIDWQTVVTADGSTATSAVAGQGYFIDTTSAAHTINLPGSPSIGDTIAIKDYASTFGTNNVTIGRNGNNIQGQTEDVTVSTNRASVFIVYVDATKGWLFTKESNVADLQGPSFITATGGTITESGDFKIHTFTGDDCFAVSSLGNPLGGPSNVDYLVVAGGGGGGAGYAGGGGAGGYRTSFPSPGCNAGTFPISQTTYPVTVGGGGTGSTGPSGGTSGSNSIFSTITSTGGGDGGGAPSASGGSGGSGGGGAGLGTSGGTGNTPPTTPPQGNNGGSGNGSPSYEAGGGGGGASTSGSSASGGGGPGGSGSTNSITSSPVTYAGGGGGGVRFSGPAGSGGPGGGGAGGVPSPSPSVLDGTSGTANTGGGGGGGGFRDSPPEASGNGGTGGKGIVIIRYKFQ